MNDEDYEVIPTSPIRRLEKRLEKMEDTTSSSQVQKLMEQVIELIKSNQRIIDDVVKSDSELRNELSLIPGKIDNLVNKMDEFINLLKAAATEDAGGMGGDNSLEPLISKINEMVSQNKAALDTNKAVLENLSSIDNRLKRLYMGSSQSHRYASI